MTTDQSILWAKISGFKLDKDGNEFSFSDRVARENGWTKNYTARVIEEYRKFIYLCCVSEEGITPSDPVDQVWHLHLTYTKSYWIDFCQETLGKPIHHNPTKGGKEESKKFNNYYSRLKDIYRYHFDKEPPPDIWHTNEVRFSDIDFQRVNLKRYWLIRKPSRYTLSLATLIIIGVIGAISIQAEDYDVLVPFGIFIVIGVVAYLTKDKDGGGSGCSGCSSSGCSGCGGGGD